MRLENTPFDGGDHTRTIHSKDYQIQDMRGYRSPLNVIWFQIMETEGQKEEDSETVCYAVLKEASMSECNVQINDKRRKERGAVKVKLHEGKK